VFDSWSVRSGPCKDWLKEAHPEFVYVFVPAGCTAVFQSANYGIMKPINAFLRAAMSAWMTECVSEYMRKRVVTWGVGVR
jgi:hypothetical protein